MRAVVGRTKGPGMPPKCVSTEAAPACLGFPPPLSFSASTGFQPHRGAQRGLLIPGFCVGLTCVPEIHMLRS